MPLLILAVCFLSGAFLRVTGIRLSVRVAAVAAALFAVACALPLGTLFEVNSAALVVPLLAYVTIAAGVLLPLRNFAKRWDLTFGVFLYAFPVSQALAMLTVHSAGFPVYTAATLLVTFPLAAASWAFVERPAKARSAHSADRATTIELRDQGSVLARHAAATGRRSRRHS